MGFDDDEEHGAVAGSNIAPESSVARQALLELEERDEVSPLTTLGPYEPHQRRRQSSVFCKH
jgi:hypothetical protein